MILGNVLGLRTHETKNIVNPEYSNLRFHYDNSQDHDPNEKFHYEFSNATNRIEREAVSAVGTSRLAQLLGMEKNVMQCNLATWRNPVGSMHYGYRYRGKYNENDLSIKSIRKLMPQNTKLRYTGEALRQLNMIKLLNILAGGNNASFEDEVMLTYSRRRDGNDEYLYVSGAYLAPMITKRFSASVDSKSLSKGTGSIKSLRRNFNMDLIDKDTADRILAISNGDVKYIFGDILNEKQLAAFNSRLRFLKSAINNKRNDEIGKLGIINKEDWTNGEKKQVITNAMRTSGRHIMKGFFEGGARIEGNEGNDDFILENNKEEQYEEFYSNLKKQIEDKDSASEKLKFLSELTFAYQKSFYDNIGNDKELLAFAAARLTSEVMTSDLVYEAFSERVEAARELKEALEAERERDKDIPASIHNSRASQGIDKAEQNKLTNEWNVYKVMARHTAVYNRYRKINGQFGFFKKAKNKGLDSKLLNVEDYINDCQKKYLERHNMTEDDYNSIISVADRIVRTSRTFELIRGQEVEDTKSAIRESLKLDAANMLPQGYLINGEGLTQYKNNLRKSIKEKGDTAAKYWADREAEKNRAREEAERIQAGNGQQIQNENENENEINNEINNENVIENVVRQEREVEVRQEENKEEVKEDIKEEKIENVPEQNQEAEAPNEEIKEEKKEEIKEENKEELKEEIKEEIKEEKKEENKEEDKAKWNKIAAREYEKIKAKKYFPEVTTGTSLKETQSEHHKEIVITKIDDEYSDYKIMSNQEVMKMVPENPANDDSTGAFQKIYEHYFVYDENKKSVVKIENKGATTAYVSSPNSMVINQYLRAKDKNDEEDIQYIYDSKKDVAHESVSGDINKWRGSIEETVAELDKATKVNTLPENTRLFRFVNGAFLQYALGMEPLDDLEPFENYGSEGSADELIKSINDKAGTVVKDIGFMSTGYKADKAYMWAPICLTILADKGTKCFVTKNIDESEIVLGRNTHYMIVGAKAHGKDGILMPKSGFEQMYNSGEEEDKPTCEFHGLEIIVKLLNDEDQADEDEKN